MSDWFATGCINWFLKPVGRALVRYLRAAALEKAVNTAFKFKDRKCEDASRILKSLDEDDYR